MADSVHPASPAQPAVPVTLGRTLRPAGDGVLSALPPGDQGAPYDRRAAAYDRLVASPLYNRLLWRASPRTYAAFAAEALQAGDGPLLDVACGSGVFTAAAYRHADRPLVLADRSLAMLERARRRLGSAAPAVYFVQADLFDLPFAAGAFETVACHGALHVFDDLPEALLARTRPACARRGPLCHLTGRRDAHRCPLPGSPAPCWRGRDAAPAGRPTGPRARRARRRHRAPPRRHVLPHRPHLTRPVGS